MTQATLTPEEVVREFFNSMGPTFDDTLNALHTFCAEDCAWHNTGYPTAHGTAEMIAFLTKFREGLGFAAFRVDWGPVLSNGSLVMAERMDYIYNEAGEELMSLKAMGAFEVREGKIVYWSDYWDTAPFKCPEQAS